MRENQRGWPFPEPVARAVWGFAIILAVTMGATFVVFAMRLTYLLIKAQP